MIFYGPEPRLEPPEPRVWGHCAYCGQDIYEDDDIAEYDGERYHEDCFHECAASILVERHGARIGVAEFPTKEECRCHVDD